MFGDSGIKMTPLDEKTLKKLEEQFPVGSRVILVEMKDYYAPPTGTRGTVTYIDSMGTIFVKWDNGSGLGVAYGIDKCERIFE